MKIISITTIKNEADIIESFVRYHLNIVDLMIVLDNGSTDDTLNILNKLVDEKLPVVVLIDEDKFFEPFIKYNYLLNIALNKYSADIICPLDCDEFITCEEGNPRHLIEEIPENSYLKLKWRTFVPTIKDDQNIKFIPSRITHIRDEKFENDFKVIITKDLVRKFNIKLSIGNHDVDVSNRFKNKINCIEHSKLNIAHFPLRSINQTKSKILLGYPNTLSRINVVKGTSFHYEVMFEKIKDNEELSMDDVFKLAKQYSLDFNKIPSKYEDSSLINIKYKPINLSFCKMIDIKYSFKESPLNNLLENYIYFAKEINKFKNDLSKANELIVTLDDINEKFESYVTTLKEDVKIIKEENFKLKNDICQLEDKYNDALERNKVLTKTKTQLMEDMVKLEKINSNQQNEINLLKNKTLKNYIIDLIK